MNIVAFSAAGMIKRTPRHFYTRQRRGGMGVFDLDTPEDEPPALLATADENESLLLFSDQGRAYRLSLSRLNESAVRAKGVPITDFITLRPGERIVAALPDGGGTQVALVGERGWVTLVRASFVGKSMIPGVAYYDAKQHGPLAGATWLASDDNDLFIATRQGLAIRFAAKRVPKSGCLGIRLQKDDTVIAIAETNEQGSVFLLGADGKGTVRLMKGFRSNKSAGGGGKVALKTEHLVGAVAVDESDDLFVISRNAKLIRFQAVAVPPKTGTVQGVNCMALRGDETTAVTATKS
jgi:DNA gyrase subunit A